MWVIHCTLDYRVVDMQGISTFTVLQHSEQISLFARQESLGAQASKQHSQARNCHSLVGPVGSPREIKKPKSKKIQNSHLTG